MKQVRNFHVVGGGCFGTQYVRWLLRARSLGMVEFEKVYAVDRDPQCRLTREVTLMPRVERVESDWEEYLSALLLKGSDASLAEDHWVPSPLSPHLIFGAFCRAARTLHPEMQCSAVGFSEELPPPVRVPLKNGDQAVSFAEWVCPVNCIEPPRCPAIQAPRTWDMKSCLGDSIERKEGRAVHVLQCRHFVHGVGTIPLGQIFGEFEKFILNLQTGKCRELLVATTSGCHGLISRATFSV